MICKSQVWPDSWCCDAMKQCVKKSPMNPVYCLCKHTKYTILIYIYLCMLYKPTWDREGWHPAWGHSDLRGNISVFSLRNSVTAFHCVILYQHISAVIWCDCGVLQLLGMALVGIGLWAWSEKVSTGTSELSLEMLENRAVRPMGIFILLF